MHLARGRRVASRRALVFALPIRCIAASRHSTAAWCRPSGRSRLLEAASTAPLLYFCSWHARKRQAEEATRAGASNAPVTADEFEFVFLSDQPDKRRKLMTFTKCRCIADEGCFQFGTHVGLVRTPQGSFEEYLSFAFSKLLRSRVRWWHAHIIEYLDLPEELQTVKAWISNAASTATMTTATITTTQQQYQTTI